MPTKKMTSNTSKITKKSKQAPKKTKQNTTKKKVVKSVKKNLLKKSSKKVAKKITKKKTNKKIVRVLICASDTECFWTTDGRVLADLHQLKIAFGSMGDDVFLHHVTGEKNDFAKWVEEVLNDDKCAIDLRKSRKSSSAKTVVIKHLRLYN